MKSQHISKKVQKLIVVIGPTASGKSEYAVKLAKKYNGEIISADSRQVYTDLNLGTGKVEGSWQTLKSTPQSSLKSASTILVTAVTKMVDTPTTTSKNLLVPTFHGREKLVLGDNDARVFAYKGIAHYCIDFVNPKKQYSVAEFQKDATKAIHTILAKGKTPILCGGTGQFIDSIVLQTTLPEVPPNPAFRKRMESKTAAQLFALLKMKDPKRAANIDVNNPRRLIRALEIIEATGKPVPPPSVIPEFSALRKYPESRLTDKPGFRVKPGMTTPIEIHYLNPSREILFKKIEKRLKERVLEGMVREVQTLHKQGVTWRRMEDFGLEYRYLSRFLRDASIPKKNAVAFLASSHYTQLLSEIKHYAKRQQTWFKKYEPLCQNPKK